MYPMQDHLAGTGGGRGGVGGAPALQHPLHQNGHQLGFGGSVGLLREIVSPKVGARFQILRQEFRCVLRRF